MNYETNQVTPAANEARTAKDTRSKAKVARNCQPDPKMSIRKQAHIFYWQPGNPQLPKH